MKKVGGGTVGCFCICFGGCPTSVSTFSVGTNTYSCVCGVSTFSAGTNSCSCFCCIKYALVRSVACVGAFAVVADALSAAVAVLRVAFA